MPPVALATVENMTLDHWWLKSNINVIDLTVSCTGTGQRQIKKEGLRTEQKKFGNNKTEHRLVEITVGEGTVQLFGPPEIRPCQARMKSFYSLTFCIVVGK